MLLVMRLVVGVVSFSWISVVVVLLMKKKFVMVMV